MPKWVIGLLCIVAAFAVELIAVRFDVYTTPEMDTVQMWKAMPWGFRLIACSAYLLFVIGCGVFVLAITDRFRKKPS